MKTKIETYFDTLSEAVDSVQLRLDADEVRLLDGSMNFLGDSPHWHEEMVAEPVSYGQTRSFNFEIYTLHGKQTRKFFHVQIYRMDSGRYEVNSYIL